MSERLPPTGKAFGHYRIQGQLGAGGMGVVYSAYDTVLERNVAIKVVGDRVLVDKIARDLLLREARTASSLNHPNICTIHEVGDSDGEAYIVMEQVEGQPLSSLLGTNGLPPGLVVRYGMQITDALAHAHEHGVIHRDLKSTNVVVTPEGRVKVLDFGLAARLKDAELKEATASKVPLTESRMIVGTLPYLAPELLRGHPADARTDTWALGVLLYEMASGSHPFHGRTAFELSSAILREAPTPLPVSVPTGLRAVILRCLEKSPGERYQRASDVHSALEALQGSQPMLPPAPDIGRLRWSRWLLLSAPLLFIILLLLAFSWWGLRERLFHRETKAIAPVSVPVARLRKSVAVLGFQNASKRDETAWLSTALSEMLATELSAGEKLRIIPAENIARMERDLSLTETNTLASDTLKRVHNYLGSDLILVGGYTTLGKASGGQLRLDVQLQDAATGETVASVAEAGSEINLFDLVSRVGSDLRHRVGAGELATVDAAGVQASYPTTPEAARPYAEGISKLRLLDSRSALSLLQGAVSADPKFPLAHYALALAWLAQGYDARAKDEAKLAFDLSGNLSREDRLLVEGQYREMAREWPVAIAVYSTLVGFFPDNGEYGLKLANAQSRGGKAKDALRTIAALRLLPPPQNDDPRINLSEAQAKRALGDAKGMLADSVTAANSAATLGSRFVEARARLSEGSAHFLLGDKEKALTAWEQSRQIWAAEGYGGEVAKTMINTGLIFYQMGNIPEAEKHYQEALSIWKSTGNRAGEGTALANLANIRVDQGELAAAKQMFLDVLTISRELGGTDALTLVELADAQLDMGEIAGAIANYREAIDLARQQSDRWTLAAGLAHIARAFYLHGELRSAKQSSEEALEITRQTNDKPHAARTMANFGEILIAEGDLPQARKNLEQALQIRTEIDETSNAVGTRLQLAELSIEEGNAAGAEHTAREVRDEYHKEGHADDEISAYTVLLLALQAQHKFDESEKEAGEAKPLLAKSQNVPNRLAIRIVNAQIQAASGKQDEALQNLSIAAHDAAKYGFVPDQLEARFAHADIELNFGKTASAHAELAALRTDAAGKGFGLIAQKATALMSKKQHGP
jgi:serine/threonine protein kinase/tetratricopeptide (TPR) repeat protein/TolB-like protein